MSVVRSVTTRRGILTATAAAAAAGLIFLGRGMSLPSAEAQEPKTPQKETAVTPSKAASRSRGQADNKDAIRPFRASIPEAALTELRRRIVATQRPEKETVADQSQGVPL